jgi:flagellar biosynthesis/type III secretory pathway protein FliH
MTKYERLYTADEVDGMIARAKAAAAHVQEPIGKLCVFDDPESEFGWSYDISGNAEQHRRMKELDGAMLYTTPPAAQQIDEAHSAGYSNGMTEGYEAGKAYAAAQQQCNWPTCQSEEYQQALAEQINQELVIGAAQPAQRQWTGLTDKQMLDAVILAEKATVMRPLMLGIFARAIEAMLKEINT